MKELGDGKYSVLFTPVAPVEHVIGVRINGIDITYSPTKLRCVAKKVIIPSPLFKESSVLVAPSMYKPKRETLNTFQRDDWDDSDDDVINIPPQQSQP